MQAMYFEDHNDFHALFEEDTFDIEDNYGRVFSGYVIVEGVQILAAQFTHDSDSLDGGGTGCWNDALI